MNSSEYAQLTHKLFSGSNQYCKNLVDNSLAFDRLPLVNILRIRTRPNDDDVSKRIAVDRRIVREFKRFSNNGILYPLMLAYQEVAGWDPINRIRPPIYTEEDISSKLQSLRLPISAHQAVQTVFVINDVWGDHYWFRDAWAGNGAACMKQYTLCYEKVDRSHTPYGEANLFTKPFQLSAFRGMMQG